ncbi:MAG: hypothetical protein ABIJ21_06655 [Nanoarchaeota archaeon]
MMTYSLSPMERLCIATKSIVKTTQVCLTALVDDRTIANLMYVENANTQSQLPHNFDSILTTELEYPPSFQMENHAKQIQRDSAPLPIFNPALTERIYRYFTMKYAYKAEYTKRVALSVVE